MTLDSVDIEVKIRVKTKTSYVRLNQFGDLLYVSKDIPRFDPKIASLRNVIYEQMYFDET